MQSPVCLHGVGTGNRGCYPSGLLPTQVPRIRLLTPGYADTQDTTSYVALTSSSLALLHCTSDAAGSKAKSRHKHNKPCLELSRVMWWHESLYIHFQNCFLSLWLERSLRARMIQLDATAPEPAGSTQQKEQQQQLELEKNKDRSPDRSWGPESPRLLTFYGGQMLFRLRWSLRWGRGGTKATLPNNSVMKENYCSREVL